MLNVPESYEPYESSSLHFGRPAVNRILLILLLGLLTLGSELSAEADCSAGADFKAAISSAIRRDGYVQSVTILRNELRPLRLPLPPDRIDDYVFFEIEQGGRETDEAGHAKVRIFSYPQMWRVFVHRKTKEVFRLSGFRSGNDYSSLVESMKLRIDAKTAKRVAEEHAALVYSKVCNVVASPAEAIAFVLDEVGGRRPDMTRECFDRVMNGLRRKAFGLTYESTTSNGQDGFEVILVVGALGGVYPDERSAELRRLTIQVDPRGRSRLSRDDLLFSMNLYAEECDSDPAE